MTEKRQPRERRQHDVAFDRRNFDRRSGVFYYNRRLHLGDTQMMGGTVYYAQYWFLVGEAREEFLKFLLAEHFAAFMTSGIALVTANCSGTYLNPLFAFDDVRINVYVERVRNIKLDLVFDIVKENGTSAFKAEMQIAAVANGKPIKWPNVLMQPLLKLQKSGAKKLKAA